MRNLLKVFPALVFIVIILASCGGSKQDGQLLGVLDRPKWKGINPFGMVYVPSGSLTIGAADQDISNAYIHRPKTVSIVGFFMDETEITNNEYRQFVNWVRDSIAHVLMNDFTTNDDDEEVLDWSYDLDYETEELDEMFYQGEDRFSGRKELDIRKLEYEYEWYDWRKAAFDRDMNNRSAYIREEKVNIYPDTMVWIRDFAYSYNEPYTRNYFWHPAFDDYPVVGVNWPQAKAFCAWRTQIWNRWRAGALGEVNTEDFRLPSEHEWEYAARGGHELAPYPWGGYYLRNTKGCLLANFKPGRGNYPEDGGFYTVKADAYFPNDFGLYNMAGNVSEWTETAFVENAYSFYHDMNPDLRYDAKEDDSEYKKRKVIKGGSWKDVAYFLQNSTRSYEFQDTTKSYVGFRCVLTFLGRSANDF